MHELEAQIRAYEQDQAAVEARFAAMQTQVERRDAEIARLGQMLEVSTRKRGLSVFSSLTSLPDWWRACKLVVSSRSDGLMAGRATRGRSAS